jgi:signal transduction histidine kinase
MVDIPKRKGPDMNSKGAKFRKNHGLFPRNPGIHHRRSEKSFVPSALFALSPYKKNTAYYTVSRNSSMKRFNLLIAESSRNQKSLQQSEEKLRLFNHQLSCITQSTSSVIGNEYFNNLVQSLASVFGMRYAFIGKIEKGSPKTLRTVALWDKNKIIENLTFILKDTPCEKVIDQETSFYPQNVQTYFPYDQCLVDWGIHSYLGVPLLNLEKQPFGVLSVMDEKPIEDFDHYHSILNIFAARCSSEIERMDAEAQLKLKTRELEKSHLAMKDFVSIASHDLQEPVRKIAIFGSRLIEKEDSLKPEIREHLERMQKSALRMQDLINDLLLFSRTSTQTEPFRKIDLKVVLKEVTADLEVLINKSEAKIQFSSLPTIEGNPSQIRQLFQNFLSNAIKFHEVGKPPKIEIKSRLNKQSGWEISIKDQGIGFNEKYKDRIFRPFERLHGRNEYEGTGMGLAICQKIAENHGGAISVKSQPGKGTCFSVIFPQKSPSLKL